MAEGLRSVSSAKAEHRMRRRILLHDVLDALHRNRHVVSAVPDPTEPRRIIGQLSAGQFFAVHVKLPTEECGQVALEYLRRAVQHRAAAFVAGSIDDLDVWLKGLATR